MKTIGYVDTRWKPPRKSKLELQIEEEDKQHWASKEVAVVKYDYRPVKFVLSEAAKEAFAKGIKFIKASRP